jgi:hypothetical protein
MAISKKDNVSRTPVPRFVVPDWVHYITETKTKKRYPTKGHSKNKEIK